MKKILKKIVFIVCIVLIVYICVAKPNYIKNTINIVQDTVDNVFGQKVEKYSKDFTINKLKISNSDYYYNKLNQQQKIIYDSIATYVRELNNNIKLKGYDYVDENTALQDINTSMEAFFDDHPEVFYLNSEYKILTVDRIAKKQVELDVTYSVYDSIDLENKISQIESVTNEIISNIKLESSFNNQLQIHDIFANMVNYFNYKDPNEIPEECHSIYGTLVNKKGVCDGFTKSMQILLNKVGIESIFVSGTLEKNPHAWNLVNIDGSWYHMDVTSDKSLHLKEDKSDNIVIHSYFNVTTDNIKKTHTIQKENILPLADTTDYNYYRATNKYIFGTQNLDNRLKEILEQSKDDSIYEVGSEVVQKIPNSMSHLLQNNKYPEYITSNGFRYYIILDSYIMVKNDK